jgi:hypothetical protein
MMTMLVALFALLQITVASQHGVHHHAHRRNEEIKAHMDDVAHALSKRDIGPYIAISGVCSTGTQWWGDCDSNGRQSYPRLEIRQLAQNADQWNLYLLGMERFTVVLSPPGTSSRLLLSTRQVFARTAPTFSDHGTGLTLPSTSKLGTLPLLR